MYPPLPNTINTSNPPTPATPLRGFGLLRLLHPFNFLVNHLERPRVPLPRVQEWPVVEAVVIRRIALHVDRRCHCRHLVAIDTCESPVSTRLMPQECHGADDGPTVVVVESLDFVCHLPRLEASLLLPVVDQFLKHVVRSCKVSATKSQYCPRQQLERTEFGFFPQNAKGGH